MKLGWLFVFLLIMRYSATQGSEECWMSMICDGNPTWKKINSGSQNATIGAECNEEANKLKSRVASLSTDINELSDLMKELKAVSTTKKTATDDHIKETTATNGDVTTVDHPAGTPTAPVVTHGFTNIRELFTTLPWIHHDETTSENQEDVITKAASDDVTTKAASDDVTSKAASDDVTTKATSDDVTTKTTIDGLPSVPTTIPPDHSASTPTGPATSNGFTNIREIFTSAGITSIQVPLCEYTYNDTLCYWTEVHDASDTNYAKAIEICANKNSSVAQILDKTVYDNMMENVRSKIPSGTWRRVWIELEIKPLAYIAPVDSYTRWYPGYPVTGSWWPYNTNVIIYVNLNSTSSSQGMMNYPPSRPFHGVICQMQI